MELEIRNYFGKLDFKELMDFEKDNQILIPQDYRDFLLKHNGGEPNKKVINKNYVVEWLYGFHNGPDWSTIYHAIDTYQNRVPSWYFPIAKDPYGNLFLMSLFEENYGLIAFWDHENECDGNADQYFDNMAIIAESFTEFINKLE